MSSQSVEDVQGFYSLKSCPNKVVTMYSHCKPLAKQGFSLVEIAIALAIVSFTGITLLGLISSGLVSIRQAMNTTAESEIVQSLTNEIILTTYSNLSSLSNQYFYYDVQGAPLNIDTTSSTAPANTFYTARVSSTTTDLSTTTTFTNLSAGVGSTVTISITKANQPNQPDTFPVIIANNQALLQ